MKKTPPPAFRPEWRSFGGYWWIASFCAFRRSYPLANQLLTKSCSARQIPDGTKTGQNHRKIKSRTHSVRKPLLRYLLFTAKVQFCPVTAKHFFWNMLLYRGLCCYLVFAEDIASGSAPTSCFTLRTPVKTCFTPSGQWSEALTSSSIEVLTRWFATSRDAQGSFRQWFSIECRTSACHGRVPLMHVDIRPDTAVYQLIK